MLNKKKRIKETIRKQTENVKTEAFDFEQIRNYQNKKDKSNAFQILSDRTCNDLDFDEFFMFADRTVSKVGQQFFYDLLRTIPRDSNSTKEKEKIIKTLEENNDLRLNIQVELARLGKDEAFYISSLFQDEHICIPKWFMAVPLLSVISLFSVVLTVFNHAWFLLFLPVFLLNMGIHYWNKNNLFQYVSAIPQLLRMNDVAKKLSKFDFLKKRSEECRESIKIINRIGYKMSFFRLEAKLESETGIIFWGLLELIKTLLLLEPLLLFSVIKQFEVRRRNIHKIFDFVGSVDSLISISLLRKSLPAYCIPYVKEEESQLAGIDIYHPLIPKCTSNSLRLNNKSVLLTGSNMSGKTTFIRTVGLNVIAGLTINTCFAKEFMLSRVRLFSAIRISDDLLNDKSYYFEELQTIKHMIEEARLQQSSLFLLDEIFKGTNTIERISAGKAVLSELSGNGNMVFVSTHDIELAGLLEDEYDLFHFSETIDDDNLVFDYKLKKGSLKKGNAIRMLQIIGYPDSIIREALDIANKKIAY
jgi:hypothetical protein